MHSNPTNEIIKEEELSSSIRTKFYANKFETNYYLFIITTTSNPLKLTLTFNTSFQQINGN